LKLENQRGEKKNGENKKDVIFLFQKTKKKQKKAKSWLTLVLVSFIFSLSNSKPCLPFSTLPNEKTNESTVNSL